MSRNKEFKCLWVNYFCACLSPQSPGSFQAMITETSPTERMWQQLKNYEYIYKSLYIRLNLADLLLQNKVLIKSFYTWWQNVWEQSTMKTSGGFLEKYLLETIDLYQSLDWLIVCCSAIIETTSIYLMLYHKMPVNEFKSNSSLVLSNEVQGSLSFTAA